MDVEKLKEDYEFWRQIPEHKEHAERELVTMRTNVHRMEYMFDLGWYCMEYSEDEWQKFKKVEKELRKRHSNPEYNKK